VSYGDNLFTKQKYLAALGRYKSASDAASDMAEAYLRQGFAYVAMGQYENASKAFRRGLALRSNWQGTAFRLSTLYDGAEAAKTQHIEKLALAVEDNPFDSGLLMTLGIELFFDGQFDRAELCFQNAARLGGGDEALVADFLPGAKASGAPAAKPRKVSF
jgi:tetratricopeptide (TPR) repeat protein